jgi:hypothetical protein
MRNLFFGNFHWGFISVIEVLSATPFEAKALYI